MDYKVVRPLNFDEFLQATGDKAALEQYRKVPMNDYAHNKILDLFHTYALIGGMPAVDHYEAGSRIKFNHFGNSNYNSKEIGEAIRTLEKMMLLHLIYPTTNTQLPIIPDFRKSPNSL